jgi:Rod binding domain-containing protein
MDSFSSALTSSARSESNVSASKTAMHQKYSQANKAEEGLRDFQGLMVGIMLTSMRSTVQKNEMFNGGQGEEIFEGMLDQEYSKQLSSTDMMGMDKSLRKAFNLPLNDSYDWKQVEKLSDTTLQNIDQQLSTVHFQHEKKLSVNEPLSAKVSKKLDEVVKSKELLEKLPPDEVAKLDPEFLNNWKEKRRAYIEEKGVGGVIGVGMKKLNKELLQQMFGELDFKNAGPLVGEKRKATAAYLKTAQAYK